MALGGVGWFSTGYFSPAWWHEEWWAEGLEPAPPSFLDGVLIGQGAQGTVTSMTTGSDLQGPAERAFYATG